MRVPAEICSIHTNRHWFWKDYSLTWFHNTPYLSCKPLYWLCGDQKNPFLPGIQIIHALCNFSKANKSCRDSLTLFWKQNCAFLLLFHRNQKRNLKWEKQMANNCCRFFKCIWMGFCICMWLCYFYKWLFWYVYFGLRKIKLSFHLIFESLSLF